MTDADTVTLVERLKRRYRRLAKLLLFFTLIYILIIALLLAGSYFLAWGTRPGGVSVEQWVLSCIVLVTFFIILELLAIFHYLLAKRGKKKAEAPQPVSMKGKQVHIFTLPMGAKGGVYSKTFIKIDEINVLNLRYQIIPPNDLWQKKT